MGQCAPLAANVTTDPLPLVGSRGLQRLHAVIEMRAIVCLSFGLGLT